MDGKRRERKACSAFSLISPERRRVLLGYGYQSMIFKAGKARERELISTARSHSLVRSPKCLGRTHYFWPGADRPTDESRSIPFHSRLASSAFFPLFYVVKKKKGRNLTFSAHIVAAFYPVYSSHPPDDKEGKKETKWMMEKFFFPLTGSRQRSERRLHAGTRRGERRRKMFRRHDGRGGLGPAHRATPL